MANKKLEKQEKIYNLSKNLERDEKNKIKNKNKKIKEREKRINQKNKEQRKKEKQQRFDLENEMLINMMNKKNNDAKRTKKDQKDEKEQEKIYKRKKRKKRFFKILILIMILVAGIVFALVSPIFNIREINVSGNNLLSSDTIISLSKLEEGQNLFKFLKIKTKRDIKTNPYVKDVKIKRRIPKTIDIVIEEKNRSYNVAFLNSFAYIDKQGYILEISEERVDLPTILGASTEENDFVLGNRLNNDDLEKLSIVIQIMNICKEYELDSKITSIDIEDKNNYILYLESERKEINLGDENNLNDKMMFIPFTLEENKEKEGLIYFKKDSNNNLRARFREKI